MIGPNGQPPGENVGHLGNGWPFGNFARKTAKGQQLFLTLGLLVAS